MLSDMQHRQGCGVRERGELLRGDARDCAGIDDHTVDLVVTSPPYANNYDYADAMRFEMSFFGEVRGWGDLHEHARKGLIRSCSQHVAAERANLDSLLAELSDLPFFPEIERVCRELEGERLLHSGKKHYHLMIAAYFSDMRRVWASLRRVCKAGSLLSWVVGDSAPYAVHVPLERWLGELALTSGFQAWRFEKVRDRNVKWRNRKHRVPLQEGRLWVEG
jgi:hypothetical protein